MRSIYIHCWQLLFFALTIRHGFAEDWPQFRGPGGQGISAARNVPVEWSDSKNVVWKQPIPGEGWSSPVVVRDRVYLTTAVAATEPSGRNGAAKSPTAAKHELSLRTMCLDAKTGNVVWDREVFGQESADAPKIHTKNSHASPTPIVDAELGRVYVHFGHQGTACLDLDGKVLWRNRELKYPPVHGNGGSPALIDSEPVAFSERPTETPRTTILRLLAFSCDGGSDPFLAALDRRTGKVFWKVRRACDQVKKFAFSTPLVITVAGRQQLVSPGAGSIGGFDPLTGRELWRVRYDGYSVIPRPVFGHGLIFLSTGYDSPEVLAIRPDGTGDVTDTHVAWRTRRGAPNTPSLLLVGDELYMVSDRGIASCVDAQTGKHHWQERLGGGFSASPVFAEGRVYFQDEGGTAHVLQAGKQFKRLAENKLGERTLASYAVVDGALFIRSAGHLWRIGK